MALKLRGLLLVGVETVTKAKKNLAEQLTMTLPGVPPKRGRPVTGNALSNAERQKRWRQKRAMVVTGDRIAATIKRFAKEFDLTEEQVTRELLRFALCNRNWARTGFNCGGE